MSLLDFIRDRFTKKPMQTHRKKRRQDDEEEEEIEELLAIDII